MRRNMASPTGKCGIAMDTYYPVKNRPGADRTAQSVLELEMVLAETCRSSTSYVKCPLLLIA